MLGQRHPGGEFTESLLDRALDHSGLSGPDRGLCHELVLGVVRWQATLDWLIARKTPGRTQKAALQNLLRLGLYQIFWLDRIPPHAAVHETVEQAKQSGFGPQAGFINAILRGYLREADETERILADLKAAQPALGWSHPEWLVERWRKLFGDGRSRQLLEWNNTPAKTFARVNTLKAPARKDELYKSQVSARTMGTRATRPSENEAVTALVEQWRAEGMDYDFFTRDWTGENLVFELKSHPSLASLKSFRDGGFYIQDPGTLLAVRELDPRPGETVLDLCAAPGGKTTFIAQLMNNQGRLVAHDNAPARVKLIEENCARLGVTNVEATSGSSFILHPSSFDKVLVDAPCSNTGVLRRRVDLRWRITPEEIERLRGTQLDLLIQASRAVRPGGVLVYSTCSLEPEENRAVVEQFLAAVSGFALERERTLTPFTDGVDGAFVTRLRRA